MLIGYYFDMSGLNDFAMENEMIAGRPSRYQQLKNYLTDSQVQNPATEIATSAAASLLLAGAIAGGVALAGKPAEPPSNGTPQATATVQASSAGNRRGPRIVNGPGSAP